MSMLIEQFQPRINTAKAEAIQAKKEEDHQELTLNKVKNESIFNMNKPGVVTNPEKADQAEAAYKSAQMQYTLADMKLFHEETAFRSLIASGKLMA